MAIFDGTGGYLDDLPVAAVRRFEADLLDHVSTRHPEVLEQISTTGDLPDALGDIVTAFKASFSTGGAPAAAAADVPTLAKEG